MTALACPRELALRVCGWAADADDARVLLDALGLLAAEPAPVVRRPCLPVPRHGRRGAYVLGCRCPRCTTANRLYQARWRRTRTVVTRRETVRVLVLAAPCGHGKRRAWPGQLALAIEGKAA